MGALYFTVSLISILSSVMATLGTEGTITLDDVLTEMSSMKNEMSLVRTDMSSMRNEISLVRTDMSSMRNEMPLVRNDMSSMRNDLDKLIRLVEDLRDIHVSPKTTKPTPPTLPSTTTTPTSPPLPPQTSACSSYTELSDAWRHIDYVNRGEFPYHCDRTGSSSWVTYTNLAWGSWYRFTGAAGTKLPTAPAPVGGPPDTGDQICGTFGVAWLKGGNPTIQDGIVTRDVCFEWWSGSCYYKTTVGVAACRDIHGDYFVYQLQPAPGCNNAYCAID